MRILSLFDGMSCGQIALNKLGIKDYTYYACEIDKYAIKVSSENFPNTIHLGDVTKIDFKSLPKIDLIIGGSPCQGFSFAGKQLNFDDSRSKLFFEYVRAIKEANPTYFMLENVRMKKESEQVISEHLGVEPIMINSALLSAQNRVRLYWTNIKSVSQPNDMKVYLKDVIETNPDNAVYLSNSTVKRFMGYGVPLLSGVESKARCLSAMEYVKNGKQGNYLITGIDTPVQINNSKECGGRQPHTQNRVYDSIGKSPALTASFAARVNINNSEARVRKLTVLECKRLQTVPDDYIMNVSNTQAYKMLGNGWTVDVIAHILNSVASEYKNSLQKDLSA